MKLIGLCGMSGSGKTLVGSLFATEGYLHLDCDRLVHEKVYPRQDVQQRLVEAFGSEAVAEGKINRRYIASVVFGNADQMNVLNALLQQPILEELEKELTASHKELILLDAPTLFESGLHRRCECVIGMIAPFNTCVERIMARDGISKERAKARLSSQKDEAFLRKHCDHILSNDGDIVRLTKQALRLAEQIKKEIKA